MGIFSPFYHLVINVEVLCLRCATSLDLAGFGWILGFMWVLVVVPNAHRLLVVGNANNSILND